MLIAEAKWFARAIDDLGAAAFPMLNVGSHTARFRAKDQPWIDRHLFGPAADRGRAVKHLDIRDGLGIDIVGDVRNPLLVDQLRAAGYRSVFLSNVLEHVQRPAELAAAVSEIVPASGYLFVSCPLEFPWHPDPIDTMFRPGIDELARLFPGTRLWRGAVVNGGTMLTYLLARLWTNPGAVARSLRRRREGGGTGGDRLSVATAAAWLFRTFRETCVVLRKEGAPAA